jgi:hypothetical protein
MPLSAKSLYSVFDSTLPNDGHFTIQNFEFTILDFTVSRQSGKTLSRPIINKTEQFGSEVLALLKTARSGDIFYFDPIRVKAADGTLRHLNSLSLICE